MTKPLPSTFAVSCTNTGCWIAISRTSRPHDHVLDRQRLHLNDTGTLSIAGDDAPLVPVSRPRR